MKARLVKSDIPHFRAVFDKLRCATRRICFSGIIATPGPTGLKAFVQVRIGNARNLAAVVASRPRYYAAIRENTLALDRDPDGKAAIRASFKNSRRLTRTPRFPMSTSSSAR